MKERKLFSVVASCALVASIMLIVNAVMAQNAGQKREQTASPASVDSILEELSKIDAETNEVGIKVVSEGKFPVTQLEAIKEKYMKATAIVRYGLKKNEEADFLMEIADTDADRAEALALKSRAIRCLEKALKIHKEVLKDLKKADAAPKGVKEA